MITAIFLIASIIIFNGVAIIIPKKLSKIEIYSTSLFVLIIQLIVDISFDLKYNLYGYFKAGPDLVAFLPFFGIYPAFNIIMLNYFPFQKRLITKILYITGVTIFCLIFEWLSLKTKFFYYNGWHMIYSALCYPVLIVILALNLVLIRRLLNKSR